MKLSPTIGKLAAALAKAQAELKDVQKTSSGYGYKYAPLDEVLKQARRVLSKHGIAVIQSESFSGDKVVVETLLVHESGEYISTTAEAPFQRLKGMNDYQSAGSAITYLRRYGLAAAIGIASDEDTDASGEPTYITKDEVLTLEAMLTESGADRDGFYKFFGINSLEQLTSDKYAKAVKLLEKKIKEKKAKASYENNQS